MSETVNEKILEKITEGHFDENVKTFLKAMLVFELRNSEDSSTRYSDEYRKSVRRYAPRETSKKASANVD